VLRTVPTLPRPRRFGLGVDLFRLIVDVGPKTDHRRLSWEVESLLFKAARSNDWIIALSNRCVQQTETTFRFTWLQSARPGRYREEARSRVRCDLKIGRIEVQNRLVGRFEVATVLGFGRSRASPSCASQSCAWRAAVARGSAKLAEA